VATPKHGECFQKPQLGMEALVLNTGRAEGVALLQHEGGGEKCLYGLLLQLLLLQTASKY